PRSVRKGSGASSVTPGQPTQQPWCFSNTGDTAETRPPGDSCHDFVPSDSIIMSTGSRLATTTKLLSPVPEATLLSTLPSALSGAVSLMRSKAPQDGICWNL